jgi:hypothetical protein
MIMPLTTALPVTIANLTQPHGGQIQELLPNASLPRYQPLLDYLGGVQFLKPKKRSDEDWSKGSRGRV